MRYKSIRAVLALITLSSGFLYAFVDIFVTRNGDTSDYLIGVFGLYVTYMLVDTIINYIKERNNEAR